MWWEAGCDCGKLGSMNARRRKLAAYVRRVLACGPRSRRGRKKLRAAIGRAMGAAFDLIDAQIEARRSRLTFGEFAGTVRNRVPGG